MWRTFLTEKPKNNTAENLMFSAVYKNQTAKNLYSSVSVTS